MFAPRAPSLRKPLILLAFLLAGATLAASLTSPNFAGPVGRPTFVWLTSFFFAEQDRPSLIYIALLMIVCTRIQWPPIASELVMWAGRQHRILALVAALSVLLICIGGTELVFGGYHLTRDEVMAEFDATIFRAGKVFAPVSPDWQPYAAALEPRFMLPIRGAAGFVSAYLPGNAWFRAVVGLIGDPNWTSPLLAAAAVCAAYAVARTLWPTRPGAAIVATLILATSSQVLVTAMTSYAMTAHLALNLIWLWLFLRGRPLDHIAALGIGFLATGLHQLIFHPLFVAPFVLGLWLRRRYRPAIFYTLGYATICAFWILYWQVVLTIERGDLEIATGVGPVRFISEVVTLLLSFDWSGSIGLTLKNLLRFVAWQNPAALLLVVPAWSAILRRDGIARELAAGCLLTLVAMFVILPYQGHGWGYRYLHGLIGNLSLLGGYGWIALADRFGADETRRAATIIAVASACSALFLLPMHFYQAYCFAAPYARASKAIERAGTDIVIVDKIDMLFGEDLIRNDPFLRNRPKVLDLSNLTEERLETLCSRYSVSLFDVNQAVQFGIMTSLRRKPDDLHDRLRRVLSERQCGAAVLP